MSILLCLIGVLLAVADGNFTVRELPMVNTKYGQLEGKRIESTEGRDVDVFLGVPYAKPPVGDLRFRKPESPESWEGVRSAQRFGNVCMQLNLWPLAEESAKIDEDCLFLNVIAPSWAPPEQSGFPVMMWIHGGGYCFGSSIEHGYKGLAKGLVAQGVIVVTINHRLGPWGFLSTGDDVCPGNLGLWDQTKALEWIRENIAAFNGDSGRITVFGISAGGASTDLLTLSPHSQNLFDRAILMAGTASVIWAMSPGVVEYSKEFAAQLDCDTSVSETMIECLRNKSNTELTTAVMKFGQDYDQLAFLRFTPVIDGDFLPAPVETMRQQAPKKSVIAGTGQMEGIWFGLSTPAIPPMNKFVVKDEISMETFDVFLNRTLSKETYKNADLLHVLAKHQYLTDGDMNNITYLLFKYAQILGDYKVVVPVHRDVQDMVKNKWTVRTYSFDYINPTSYLPGTKLKIPTHGAEMPYVMGQPVYFPFEFDDKDKSLVKKVAALWAQFAKTSDPNQPNDELEWPAVNGTEYSSLVIKEHPEVRFGYHQPSISFWTKLVPTVEGFAPCTGTPSTMPSL